MADDKKEPSYLGETVDKGRKFAQDHRDMQAKQKAEQKKDGKR